MSQYSDVQVSALKQFVAVVGLKAAVDLVEVAKLGSELSGVTPLTTAAPAPAKRGRPRAVRVETVAAGPVATAVASKAPKAAKIPRDTGRKPRSSAAEVQALKDQALAAAKKLGKEFSKSDVMQLVGGNVDLGRYLSLLVDEGKLTKTGEKRMTRYTVK